MANVTRRTAMKVFTFSAVLAGASALGSGTTIGAEPEKPLTPDDIVAKKVQGKATVEFAVAEVSEIPTGGGVEMTGSPQLCLSAKSPKAEKFYVEVSWLVSQRLRDIGIDDVPAHFRNKVVRVAGDVTLSKSKEPSYHVFVTSLDQIEVIRKR